MLAVLAMLSGDYGVIDWVVVTVWPTE